MNPPPKVFISYSWKDKEKVDRIDRDLQRYGIVSFRDARDLKYLESIKVFMKKIRSTDFVLIIISDSYVKSMNCMFEVLEFVKDDDFKQRIIPVILNDARIFRPEDRLEYIHYWQNEKARYDEKLKGVDLDNIGLAAQDAKFIKSICMTVGDFLYEIANLRCIPYADVETANYTPLLHQLGLDIGVLDEFSEVLKGKGIEEMYGEVGRFLTDHPKFVMAYFLKAELEMQRGEENIALTTLEHIMELEPELALPYFNRGNYYLRTGEYPKAIEDYSRAIEREPEFLELYSHRGEAYHESGEAEKASADFTTAIEAKHDVAENLVRRAQCRLASGNYDSGLKDAAKAIDLRPDYADAFLLRGFCFHNKREYRKAIANFARALKLAPTSFRASHGAAMAYLKLNEIDRAVSHLEKAVESEPDLAETYIDWAYKFVENREHSNAILFFTKAILHFPGRAALLYTNRGTVFTYTGENAHALQDFTAAIQLDPQNTIAINNRAGLLTKMRKYAEAIEDCKRSIAIDPDGADAYYNLACAYAMASQRSDAISSLRRAIQIDPSYKIQALEEPELRGLLGDREFMSVVKS